MVFIDKTSLHSIESKNRLENWKAQFGEGLAHLYAEPNQTGDNLWKIEDYEFQNVKDRLREDLNVEQGKICCYCCQRLESGQTKIEHFLAKSAPDCLDKPQAFAERVFNYDNLLLSCDGGEKSQHPYEVKVNNSGNLETKQEIANRLYVSTELLDKLNPTATYSRGERIKYTEGLHCDTHKGNNTLPIFNPTVENDYWAYFNVQPNGEMSVDSSRAAAIQELANNTLTVLNLKESRLTDKRQTAWKKFEEILLEQEEFNAAFPDAEKLYAFLEDYLTIQLDGDKDAQNKTPFCFVNYHFINNLKEGVA
jgi:uncharacterized protein (TIGR02646 family)